MLIDFGEAIVLDTKNLQTKKNNDFVGTIHYVAPEIMRTRYHWEIKKSDLWSIGIIAFALVCGTVPFYDNQNKDNNDKKKILKRIQKGKFSFPKHCDCRLSQSCKHFIRSLLNKDTGRRLSAKQALEHPWIVSEAKADTLGDYVLNNMANFMSTS